MTIRPQSSSNVVKALFLLVVGKALSAVLFGQSKRQQRRAGDVYNQHGPTISGIEVVPASSGFGFALQF